MRRTLTLKSPEARNRPIVPVLNSNSGMNEGRLRGGMDSEEELATFIRRGGISSGSRVTSG